MSILLPLFPLDVVLLPGVPLPLHIFEPRYREMISECLAQEKPFGVVRVKEEGVAEIGCTAEIIIVTEGRERFEVMHMDQERSFLRAEVLYLRDEPATATAAEIERALNLHGEIMGLAGAAPEKAAEIDRSRLSFHLAGSLPLDLDFKQTLLGMKSESERVQGIISYFETILPGLRRAVRARKRAGGNGHVD